MNTIRAQLHLKAFAFHAKKKKEECTCEPFVRIVNSPFLSESEMCLHRTTNRMDGQYFHESTLTNRARFLSN